MVAETPQNDDVVRIGSINYNFYLILARVPSTDERAALLAEPCAVRDRCTALVSNSVTGMVGDAPSVMLDDPDAVAALEREFDAYLAFCCPLADMLSPDEGDDITAAIDEFTAGDVVAAAVPGAVVLARAGVDALVVSSASHSFAYRVSEPRLADAIALYIERLPNRTTDPAEIAALLEGTACEQMYE